MPGRSVLLLGLVVGVTPGLAWAEEVLQLEFRGQVAPIRTVTIANRLDAVVDEVLFAGGERVSAGDPLFVLDQPPFEIAVDAAKAAVEAAEARLALTEDAAERQAQLLDRGTGSRVRAFETRLEQKIARAELAERRAELAAAELRLDRTRIAAPISGHIGQPFVAKGAFVEAEGGTALAEIVQLDPVRVSYGVPYADRMAALAAAGTSTVEALFERIELELVLPDGSIYHHPGQPGFESARIEAGTGMLTTWATFPNPEGVLVPGLEVTVLSSIGTAEAGQ